MTSSSAPSTAAAQPGAASTAPAQPSPASPVAPAVLMILGSCTSLQFGAALAAQLFPALGSWGVTCLRLGIAAIVLLVLVRPAVRGWNGGQWRAVLAFGLALGAMNGSFYAAIERIPLGTAVAIEFLGPLVLSAILSRRVADLACVVLALAGIGMFGLESLAGAGALDPIGVLFALIAAVFWGFYVLASAHVGRHVPGQGGLAVALAIGALALLPLGAGGALTAVTRPGLLLLAVATALLASVIPYTLELAALRRLPRHVFGILLSLEPAIATIAGLVLLAQVPTVYGLLAVVLVVAASAGTTITARRAQSRGADDADRAEGRPAPSDGELETLPVDEYPAALSVQAIAEPEAVTGQFPVLDPQEREADDVGGPDRP
ncbi:DMT family transporter [Brachybacterium sp. NPDC056505]|uniref:EamA family transporter n=1 Tax=Brachybacterium sp. NPDC056505 TaxID=3345843 RepID=UPI0036713D68